MSGQSVGDFFYVTPQRGHDNLRALFNADRLSDIPRNHRAYLSRIENKYIYLLIEPSSGQRAQLMRIHYRSSIDWSADIFEEPDNGPFQPIRTSAGDGQRLTLDRRYMSATHAIALPDMVNPQTAVCILRGGGATNTALQDSRALFRLIATDHPDRIQAERGGHLDTYTGPDMRLIIFDPGHIISHTASAIRIHNYKLRMCDARQVFRRLSDNQKHDRYKGILVSLIKQMKDSNSSFDNDVNESVLNTNFNRFANYGRRIALLFDNLYNFLSHPIMDRLKQEFMEYKESNVSVDGHAWLGILRDLLPIATQHEIMAQYFDLDSQNPATESSFSTFFKMALRTGQARETNNVRRWGQLLQHEDTAKIVENIANIRSYQLVAEYTGGSSLTWANFNSQLTTARDNLNSFNSRAGVSAMRAGNLRNVRLTFTWANRIAKFKAIFSGDLSASTFTAAVGAIEDIATHQGFKNIASLCNGIKNIVDAYGNATGLASTLRLEDYDAAFGRGLALGAGVVELGYLVMTGTTLGGPVGAFVTIVGAIGAVIVATCTDSTHETFVRYSFVGSDPHGSTSIEDWCTVPFNNFTDTLPGVKRQLDTLLNLMYNFTVHYKYDENTHVVAIEIRTKFFTETTKFRFKAEFNHNGGGTTHISADVYFNYRTRRSSSSYRNLRYNSTGPSAIRGINARVYTDTGSSPTHIICINIGGVSTNLSGATAWIQCLPFGHDEFIVPKGRYLQGVVPYTRTVPNAFWLQDLVTSRWFFRDLDFEPSSYMIMPSW